MKRDVVIVGAGPAGSVAAAGLARRGRDVLLIDRSDFPRDKVCGDGIPPGTVEALGAVGAADGVRAAGFNTINRIRIGSPSGRVWETGFRPRRAGLEFYVAPRARFDAILRDHAVTSGAEFRRAPVKGLLRDGARVTGIVTGEGDEIEARVTIGADGATSVVARELGLLPWPRGQRDVAVRGYVDGIDAAPHTVEFYFHRPFLPGYGWVFPLGDRAANVGVIVRVDRLEAGGESLRDLLGEFLDTGAMRGRIGGARVSSVSSWQLPLAAPGGPSRAFDGALLVGDAGGFVDPLTGEGIHTAVRTGVIAAGVVDEALGRNADSGLALKEYDARCESRLGALTKRSYRCQRWIASAPVVLELLFMLAKVAPAPFRGWLNHISSDFVVGG